MMSSIDRTASTTVAGSLATVSNSGWAGRAYPEVWPAGPTGPVPPVTDRPIARSLHDGGARNVLTLRIGGQ